MESQVVITDAESLGYRHKRAKRKTARRGELGVEPGGKEEPPPPLPDRSSMPLSWNHASPYSSHSPALYRGLGRRSLVGLGLGGGSGPLAVVVLTPPSSSGAA